MKQNFTKNQESEKKMRKLLIINHLPPPSQKSCHKTKFAMKTKILFLGILLGLFLGCDKEIILEKANLSFEKLTIDGKTISTKQIFAQIKEKEKAGFQIKNITINNSEIAEVQGSKPNFSILIKKAGTFKITLILEKAGFEDVKIVGEITIIKKIATFEKLTITNGAKVIFKNQILEQIRGLSGLNYTIKSIEIPMEQSDFAEVKNDFSIEIKKVGNFTADITFEKQGFLDVKIQNCEFEIGNAGLRFEKLTITNGAKIITENQILGQIKGLTNLDYQIKSIEIPAEKAEFAEAKNDFSIEIKKVGNWTANIILEKNGFLDVAIQNCTFEIQNKTFTFQKLSITNGKNLFSTQEILAKIQGEKTDYSIKNITISDLDKAEVLGNKPNFSIEIKKVGNFTANIILEKSGFLDVEIENCEFEIGNKNAFFEKLTITNGSLTITKAQILLKNSLSSLNYTIKSIEIPAEKAEFAEVEGSKPNFSIKIKKTGNFTANIILEKNGFLDVKIQNCAFEIQLTQKYINAFNQAKTLNNYDNSKAEIYASARDTLSYTDVQAKAYVVQYSYAKTTLHYTHEKAGYYAYGKFSLGYTEEKAKLYVKARTTLSYTDTKAKAYATYFLYAKTTLKYHDYKASIYFYARHVLGYEDLKAQFYILAENLYNSDTYKKNLYIYARMNFNYNDAQAQYYVEGKQKYSISLAKEYVHARHVLRYNQNDAMNYITAFKIAKADGIDGEKLRYYTRGYVEGEKIVYHRDRTGSFTYRPHMAKQYAFHFAYGRADLGYNYQKARTYASKRYYVSVPPYGNPTEYRKNEKYAKAFVKAKYDYGYDDSKADHYAQKIDEGKTDAEAQAYANSQ